MTLPLQDERLIDSKEFARRLGVSLTSFKRRRAAPNSDLPRSVRVGRCVRWRLSQVLQFIEDLEP